MRKATITALAIALSLIASACGGSTEDEIAERIAENLIENSDGDIKDIDINTNDGGLNITFEGEDGEEVNVVSQGEDGEFNMTIEGEDGQSFSIGSGSVPDGMKTTIADGGNVVQSYNSDNDRSVTIEYPSSRFDELVALYESEFQGVEDVSKFESSNSTDDGVIRNVGWFVSSGNTNVNVSDCYTMSSGALDAVCVTIYELDS